MSSSSVSAEPLGDRVEVVGERRDVEPDDLGAVAMQRLGDRRADAARGAGDQRDLAVERLVPVERRCLATPAPIRTTWPET